MIIHQIKNFGIDLTQYLTGIDSRALLQKKFFSFFSTSIITSGLKKYLSNSPLALSNRPVSQDVQLELIKSGIFISLLYYRQLALTAVGLDEKMTEGMGMFGSAFDLLFIKTVAEFAQWLPLQPLTSATTTTSSYLSSAVRQSYKHGERASYYLRAKLNPEKYANLCKYYLFKNEFKNALWTYQQAPFNEKSVELIMLFFEKNNSRFRH